MLNMQQTLLQFINVVHPRLIDLLLYLAVDRVEVRTVWWPQIRWNESRRCLLEKLYNVRFAKIRTSNFRKVVRQQTEGVWEVLYASCWKFGSLSAVKEF